MHNKRKHRNRILSRLQNKIHKTFNTTAKASYNLFFWSACMVLMYGYVLHYSSKGYPNPIDWYKQQIACHIKT